MNLGNYGIVEGRLTNDITISENRDGSKRVLFTLAVQNNYKSKTSGKKETQFIPMLGYIAAGQTANIYNYIHKGDLICVAYELKSESFYKDGKHQYRLNPKVNHIELKEPKFVTDTRLAKREQESAADTWEEGEYND